MSVATLDSRPQTQDPVLDGPRLDCLRQRVFDLMVDGEWRSLGEIQMETGGETTGVSAKLRDLRKETYGGHTVETRRKGRARDGHWEYRLVARVAPGCQMEFRLKW